MTPRLALACLLLLTLWSYRSVRTAEFVYEDANAVQNPAVIDGARIAVNRARFVTLVSHRLVFIAFGPSARAPHVVNVGLHLVNGVLLYAIAVTFVAPWAAVLACGVFLLHPVQTETVAYVASRSELLSTSFALLAFWISLEAKRWWQHVAIWCCVALAIGAKESSAVIVPLMALADVHRGRRLSPVRLACLVLPIAAMAVSVFRFDYVSKSELGAWAYAATQATALWRYLALVLIPIGQTVDHDFELVPWAVRWAALFGVFAIATFPLLSSLSVEDGETKQSLRLWDDSDAVRVAAFGVTWLLVASAPRFLMRITETLNEHQTYAPFIGLWLALAATVGALSRETPLHG